MPRCAAVAFAVALSLALAGGATNAHALGGAADFSTPLGGEAAALGGAYTAASEDATGLLYNPAGIAFSKPGYTSSSYNAYTVLRSKSSGFFLGSDWRSEAVASPFFAGATYSDPALAPGWTIGGAFYEERAFSSRRRWTSEGRTETGTNARYLLTDRQEESELRAALAAARRLSRTSSLGLSLTLMRSKRTFDSFQQSRVGPIDFHNAAIPSGFYDQTSNIDNEALGYGLEPGIGWMLRPSRAWSFGVSLSQGLYFRQSGREITNNLALTTDEAGNPLVIRFGEGDAVSFPVDRSEQEVKLAKPFGRPPLEARVGLAYSSGPGTRWLVDAKVTGPGRYENDGVSEERLRTTGNAAAGVEHRLAASFTIRGGAYTRFDPTQTQLIGRPTERRNDYIDLYAATTGLSYEGDGFSVTFGGIAHRGIGRMEAADGGDVRFTRLVVDGGTVSLGISSRD